MDINEKLVNLLIKKDYRITTAESCTGGLLSASIVDVANASKVFDMSFVTYANDAKIELLNVDANLIYTHGVVSEEVAAMMSIGAAKRAKANVAIATSGIAGPAGGTPNKPVGMVCFGIYINGEVYTYTKHFGDIGRNNVRASSVDFALNEAYSLILKM